MFATSGLAFRGRSSHTIVCSSWYLCNSRIFSFETYWQQVVQSSLFRRQILCNDICHSTQRKYLSIHKAISWECAHPQMTANFSGCTCCSSNSRIRVWFRITAKDSVCHTPRWGGGERRCKLTSQTRDKLPINTQLPVSQSRGMRWYSSLENTVEVCWPSWMTFLSWIDSQLPALPSLDRTHQSLWDEGDFAVSQCYFSTSCPYHGQIGRCGTVPR